MLFTAIHAYSWSRWPGASLSIAPVMSLAGGQHSLYAAAWRIATLPEHVAQYTILYVMLRILLRRTSLATAVFFLCMVLVPGTHGSVLSALPVYFVLAGFATWILARAGLVAAAAYQFTLSTIDRCPWPHSLSDWLFIHTLLSFTMVSLLIAAGVFLAIGEKRLAAVPGPADCIPLGAAGRFVRNP